jgi:ribosomal protein S18 acetylase RimI-like enzyme
MSNSVLASALGHSPVATTAIVREATVEDLADIQALFFAIYAEVQFNDVAKGFNLLERMTQRYVADPEKHSRDFWGSDKARRFGIVIRERGTNVLLGAAWLITKFEVDQEPTGEINKIYFHPALRGKGMGSWVLNLLIEKAKELRFQKLFLITAKELDVAVGLYGKSGFRPVPQERYNNSPNSIAMEMILS